MQGLKAGNATSARNGFAEKPTDGMGRNGVVHWLLTALLAVAAAATWAVPARPGCWQLLTLDDGTEVAAQLVGDESAHCWLTAEGRCYVAVDGHYVEVEPQLMARRWQQRSRERAARRRESEGTRRRTYTGSRRGVAILVDFPNCHFSKGHDLDYYRQVFNQQGFSSDEGYVGSVSDYFLDQSYGQFHLTFDVVGPVTMPQNYAYYGRDNRLVPEDIDQRVDELIVLACQQTLDSLDLASYDWNEDGEVDQILIIYAGRGQADGGSSDTIWPQEWFLTETRYGKALEMGGYTINTYSCTNELSSSGAAGIGNICHEYAHCLGLPDMYDTFYTGNFGLKSWSLMDTGSYNGKGFVPAGFTAFERMSCGWLTPTPLVADTVVADMQPLVLEPVAYMVGNDGWADEFYLMENRQKTGWDSGLPGAGMLIFHVDYNDDVWFYNEVNCTSSATKTRNDHQRCTIFLADNRAAMQSGDTYPSGANDSLTATSLPAAKWYNADASGSTTPRMAITDITQQEGQLMSFRFSAGSQSVPDGVRPASADADDHAVYTLGGQRVGTSLDGLPHGVYICNRKKIIK